MKQSLIFLLTAAFIVLFIQIKCFIFAEPVIFAKPYLYLVFSLFPLLLSGIAIFIGYKQEIPRLKLAFLNFSYFSSIIILVFNVLYYFGFFELSSDFDKFLVALSPLFSLCIGLTAFAIAYFAFFFSREVK